MATKSTYPAPHSVEHEHTEHDVHTALHSVMTQTHPEQFVEQSGPLTVEDVPDDIRKSQAFSEFVAMYGWPSHENREGMQPAPNFDSDEAFWLALWKKHDPNYLNNFIHWFRTEPKDGQAIQNPYEDPYAMKPALHRAYVLAPEFMGALRDCMNELYEVDRVAGVIEDAPLEHPETVRAAHIAYRLIARLVTADDMRILSDMHLAEYRLSDEVPSIKSMKNYLFM